jgi:hypothetical protein
MPYVCVICSPNLNNVTCNSLTAQLIQLLFLYYTAYVSLCILFSIVLQFTFWHLIHIDIVDTNSSRFEHM